MKEKGRKYFLLQYFNLKQSKEEYLCSMYINSGLLTKVSTSFLSSLFIIIIITCLCDNKTPTHKQDVLFYLVYVHEYLLFRGRNIKGILIFGHVKRITFSQWFCQHTYINWMTRMIAIDKNRKKNEIAHYFLIYLVDRWELSIIVFIQSLIVRVLASQKKQL